MDLLLLLLKQHIMMKIGALVIQWPLASRKRWMSSWFCITLPRTVPVVGTPFWLSIFRKDYGHELMLADTLPWRCLRRAMWRRPIVGCHTWPGLIVSAFCWICSQGLANCNTWALAHLLRSIERSSWEDSLLDHIVGLCLLHMLWKLPHIEAAGKLGGIACPPELLSTIPAQKGQRLQLFHYTPDKLCCWQPNSRTIQSLPCLCTIVENSIPELKDHFGKCEHGYGHWLQAPLVEGEFSWFVANIGWISWTSQARCRSSEIDPMAQLSPQHASSTMAEFSKVEPVHSNKILQAGGFHLPHAADSLHTWDDMRDAIIGEITLKGIANPPQIAVDLMRNSIQRLPLPRLIHFNDLVLPQMVRVCSPSQPIPTAFPGSQLVRDQWIAREEGRSVNTLVNLVSWLFKSRANIEHISVNWNGKAVTTLRQNVTMGLKKGHTVLLHFQVQGIQYQAILMMVDSVPGSKGGDYQHKLWKHVLPRQTEFAWLPPDFADWLSARVYSKL